MVWQETTKEQALLLDRLFQQNNFDLTAQILDCACGIGTQTIGLAARDYAVTGSDLSAGELEEAEKRGDFLYLGEFLCPGGCLRPAV